MVDTPNFELYTKKHSRGLGRGARITLHRGKVIGLNRRAHELIGSPESVVLLYAEHERAIGVREATSADGAYSYPLRIVTGGASRYISAGAYLKRYGIAVPTLTHLPAALEDGILTARVP